MHDQTPERGMASIMQIMEGLKAYGLLSAIQNNPKMWEPIFSRECVPLLTPTTMLDEFEIIYSDSQQIREKESDVFFYFSSLVNSLEFKELRALLQWAIGSPSIPLLGHLTKESQDNVFERMLSRMPL